MKKALTYMAFTAGAALAAGAMGGPMGQGPGGDARRHVSPPGGGVTADGFADDFDSYKTGSDIVGQGGWEVWFGGQTHATLSDEQARSDPNSLRNIVGSDIVHQFAIDQGVWDFSIWTYAPSTAGADAFVILMNQYGPNNALSWSMQIRFAIAENIVESQWDLAQLPLIVDQWVELRAHIDLDNDTWDSFYDGQPLATGLIWTNNNFDNPLEGITSIAAVDLYNDSAEPFYFDNISLQPAGGGCYPDFNGDGALDLFDFLGFVNAFNANDAKADCDGNQTFDLFDFLCFVNAFNAGC